MCSPAAISWFTNTRLSKTRRREKGPSQKIHLQFISHQTLKTRPPDKSTIDRFISFLRVNMLKIKWLWGGRWEVRKLESCMSLCSLYSNSFMSLCLMSPNVLSLESEFWSLIPLCVSLCLLLNAFSSCHNWVSGTILIGLSTTQAWQISSKWKIKTKTTIINISEKPNQSFRYTARNLSNRTQAKEDSLCGQNGKRWQKPSMTVLRQPVCPGG